MTRKAFKAARDCTSKIRGLTPPQEKIDEMLSLLTRLDRLAEIGEWEGPTGIRVEAAGLPEDTAYEEVFKESIYMWMGGCSVAEAVDHAADRYFLESPDGYDAAIFYAVVFGLGGILTGEFAHGFIDKALQYLLPDGWRWYEEDKKEAAADSSLHPNHRIEFLGDNEKEVRHRFDDTRVCELIADRDAAAEELGIWIADRLRGFKDGALQLILRQLTLQELERALYALPAEAEDRIISNFSSYYIAGIKGSCILNRDTVSPEDILAALMRLEEEIAAYDGDPALEAEYEN